MKLRLNRYKDFQGPQNPYKLWPHMGIRHLQKEPKVLHTAYQHLNHWRMRKGIHQLTKIIAEPLESVEIKNLAYSLLIEVFLTYEDYSNMGQVLQAWQDQANIEYYRHQYFYSYLTGDWMGLAQQAQMFIQMGFRGELDDLDGQLRRTSRLIEENAWNRSFKLDVTPQYIIVLGCPLLADGRVSPILEQRLEISLNMAKKHSHAKLFLTGGAVINQHIESQGMKEYLLTRGIEESRLILDSRAKDTIGNAMVLKEWLKQQSSSIKCIGLVSHANHLPRAWMVFQEVLDNSIDISIYPAENSKILSNALKIHSLKDLLKLQADIYRIRSFLL